MQCSLGVSTTYTREPEASRSSTTTILMLLKSGSEVHLIFESFVGTAYYIYIT
jgi:hypothetical protein